jgi:hypothetical protein
MLADKEEVSSGGEYSSRYEKKWAHPDFHQTLLDIASKVGEIDTRRLGHYLGKYLHRIIDGTKIMADEDTHSKQKKWWLEKMDGGSK